MAGFDDLQPGQIISFETIAPGILPRAYSSVNFGCVAEWWVAATVTDIATLHRQLYPSLMSLGVKDDYKSYNYILINTGGIPFAVGIPWIKSDSLVVSGSKDVTLVFPNITEDKKIFLKQVLAANGFNSFYEA